jgi:RND family efflux transporter MFP subunit
MNHEVNEVSGMKNEAVIPVASSSSGEQPKTYRNAIRFVPRSFVILALVLPVLVGCKPKAPADSKQVERPVVLGPENYTVVVQRRLETGPTLSGSLRPKKEATMRAQISGEVLSTYAEQGQAVGDGTLLAQIDDRTIRSSVESAQSALANAQNSYNVTKRDQERMEALLKAGAISERDVDNARRATIAAQASVVQAQSQLTAAQKQLSYAQVRAPFVGRVSAKLISTGDIVQPGNAMYTVVDPSSMELQGSLPADQLSLIHVGDAIEFNVSGYPDRTFTGRITRINPTADPATRQVQVFAELPNGANNLVGDLFAEGRITTQARNTLTVPSAAIDRKLMQPAVMRVRGGKVERIQVTLGLTDTRTDRVEILSGAQIGDTLLIGPALSTAVGTKIQFMQGTAASGTAGGGVGTIPSGGAGTSGPAATGTSNGANGTGANGTGAGRAAAGSSVTPNSTVGVSGTQSGTNTSGSAGAQGGAGSTAPSGGTQGSRP